MDYNIKNFNKTELRKVFRRLKKDTKGFSSLIVRDPLDYLDFAINLDKNLDLLVYEVNSHKYHPAKPYLHLSAKNKGINRPTVVFDIKDALVYRFCVEQIEDELFDKTRNNKNIRGGIKITANKNNNGDDYYEKWFKDWKEYQEALEKSLNDKKYLVITDIASYFENINILVLKDLIRTDINGKQGVLNLLFYFLENCRFRFCYEVNTFNGLPQEDIDCSRVLAYYFLGSHDEVMAEFCKDNDCEFYRFVDDMAIAVNKEVVGKRALKCLTESLRRLNLVSSIEKTSILNKKQAREELFFEENKKLSEIETEIFNSIKNGEELDKHIKKIGDYYKKLKDNKKYKLKNWIKILKRFYSLCTYTKSDLLMSEINNHLLSYPILFSGNKIIKYLLRMRENENKFNQVINELLDYLLSDENLYPVVETNILEIILTFDPVNFQLKTKNKIKKVAVNLFFKNKVNPLSEYSRALACLLVYRYGEKDNIESIAKHYLKSNENDYLFKKYIIFTALTVKNNKLRQRVLDKAKKEQNDSINRLVNFIENLSIYQKDKLIKKYIKNDEIYIYFDKKNNLEIKEKYKPVRVDILKDLIEIYK